MMGLFPGPEVPDEETPARPWLGGAVAGDSVRSITTVSGPVTSSILNLLALKLYFSETDQMNIPFH